ncbi:GNAT family N-acetyltransferase [Sphingomonas antarctica]|uniref:GNAT family N-acetyltransferase n=1 Tax=Sphingomonas antarctica TaxID=2040274 RepID=UPI0039EC54C6
MSPLGPKDAIFLFNWILAALPTSLTNQPQFLAFASGTLSDALARWPVFNDSAGVALRDADGSIVAACAIIADPTANSATLAGPFVEPGYRRRGLATLMLEECQSICVRQNIVELTSCIPTRDCNMCRFLLAAGFEIDRNAKAIVELGSRAWETLKRDL